MQRLLTVLCYLIYDASGAIFVPRCTYVFASLRNLFCLRVVGVCYTLVVTAAGFEDRNGQAAGAAPIFRLEESCPTVVISFLPKVT